MHFVDEVDFVTSFRRSVANVVPQLAHVFYAVIAGAVDLDDVETVAGRDLAAVIAYSAGSNRRPMDTVERLGQNSGGRRLTHTAGTDKQIRVRQTILGHRVFQRLGHMGLANEIVECLRPVFPRENLVTHCRNLKAPLRFATLKRLKALNSYIETV